MWQNNPRDEQISEDLQPIVIGLISFSTFQTKKIVWR